MLHSFVDDDGAHRLYSPAGLIRLIRSRSGYPVAAGQIDIEAFERLCAAFETARPQQTAFGKLHAQAILLDALAKRFRLASYLQQFGDIGATALPQPIFIVAPFRTGTTILHRLLACDPQNRTPRIWEVAYPPPPTPHLRGDARYTTDDARIAHAAAALRALHRASPALSRLHPMAPDLAEECFGLLETSFRSHSFMFYAELPSYLEWLDTSDDADRHAAYQIYADQLRLLHWWCPGRRWGLKSPVHLSSLDTLLQHFPQAYIIQLHRDPVHAMASFCRLLAAYRQLMCNATEPHTIGAQACRYTRTMLQRGVAARRSARASHFIDIQFADLIRDPVACVQTIYARIGAHLTPEAVAAMRASLAQLSQVARAPDEPVACLETFGLDRCELRDMWAAYTALMDPPAAI
jgi:hypothetical protein